LKFFKRKLRLQRLTLNYVHCSFVEHSICWVVTSDVKKNVCLVGCFFNRSIYLLLKKICCFSVPKPSKRWGFSTINGVMEYRFFSTRPRNFQYSGSKVRVLATRTKKGQHTNTLI